MAFARTRRQDSSPPPPTYNHSCDRPPPTEPDPSHGCPVPPTSAPSVVPHCCTDWRAHLGRPSASCFASPARHSSSSSSLLLPPRRNFASAAEFHQRLPSQFRTRKQQLLHQLKFAHQLRTRGHRAGLVSDRARAALAGRQDHCPPASDLFRLHTHVEVSSIVPRVKHSRCGCTGIICWASCGCQCLCAAASATQSHAPRLRRALRAHNCGVCPAASARRLRLRSRLGRRPRQQLFQVPPQCLALLVQLSF